MTNRETVMSNIVWRFAERCGAQGVSFIVSIVLARLLDPEAYGTVALVTVFTTVLQVFIDSGLGNALIQKKDADDVDFSTVFYFNFVVCCLLYVAMYFMSPVIASFYGDESLVNIIRVLCLTLVISGLKNVQQAYVSRTLQFKKFFFSSLAGTIGSAVIGIAMAYMGFGVWALVLQQLINVSVGTAILWLTVKWHPKKVFSFIRLKGLFSFGWKLLVSTLIDTFYNNVRQLIIGKIYSATDLAFFNRGNQFPQIIVTNINTSIDSVLFPALSKEQDNITRVRSMTRRSISVSTYIMAPLMMGLAFCAEPIVSIVLTDKWLACVPYLRIFCITYMFYPIHTANLKAIVALGRSDINLKLEIIKKVVGITLLVSTMWFGVMAMAYSLLVNSIISQIINSWPNKKLLNYGYLEQLKDILPGIFLAIGMGIIISLIELLHLNNIFTLIIQVVVGAVIYLLGSKIFHLDSFDYLLEIIKSKLRR